MPYVWRIGVCESARMFPECHDSASIAKRITDSNLLHRMRQMFSNPFQRMFCICHARSTGDPAVCGISLRQSVTSALLRAGAQAGTRERNRNRIAVSVNYGFSISSSRSSASRRISAELISSLRMRMLATSIWIGCSASALSFGRRVENNGGFG